MYFLFKVVVCYCVLVKLLTYRMYSQVSVPGRTRISGQGLHLEPGLKCMELYLQLIVLSLLRRRV
jgi:hypothetical protein